MSTDLPTLLDLFRAYPVRSAVLSVAPVVVATAQGVNAVVHGLRSPLVVVFVLGLLAFAFGATTHHLAAFRTESLEAEFADGP